MNLDLFSDPMRQVLGAGTVVLRRFALADEDTLLDSIAAVVAAAPFRHMCTPGGLPLSAAMTNCGALGWVTDRGGYRYQATDPESGEPWPAMPEAFLRLARVAAEAGGFPGFVPDACLINRYIPGSRLTMHQDKDEADLHAPIVSVSLGIDAVFVLGGFERAEPGTRVPLSHGDVVVWGGPDRMRFHGVRPLVGGNHRRLGQQRINLTLRRAG